MKVLEFFWIFSFIYLFFFLRNSLAMMKREIGVEETSYEFVVPTYVKGDDVVYRSTKAEIKKMKIN